MSYIISRNRAGCPSKNWHIPDINPFWPPDYYNHVKTSLCAIFGTLLLLLSLLRPF